MIQSTSVHGLTPEGHEYSNWNGVVCSKQYGRDMEVNAEQEAEVQFFRATVEGVLLYRAES